MKGERSENFKCFKKWLTTKKGIGTHSVDKVIINEDFQQEFALFVNYVAFKFTKEKGDVFELSKACTIVASAQVDLNHCVYNELLQYVALHESSLNGNALCNITKSYYKSTGKTLDKKDLKLHYLDFVVDRQWNDICQVNMDKKPKNTQDHDVQKIDISCNIKDSVNLELFDIDVDASGNLGINYD
jgi:hypothetical protein